MEETIADAELSPELESCMRRFWQSGSRMDACGALVVRRCIEEGIEQVRSINARATESQMTNNGFCFPDGLSVKGRTDQIIGAALQIIEAAAAHGTQLRARLAATQAGTQLATQTEEAPRGDASGGGSSYGHAFVDGAFRQRLSRAEEENDVAFFEEYYSQYEGVFKEVLHELATTSGGAARLCVPFESGREAKDEQLGGRKVRAPVPLFQARIHRQTSRGHTYTK